MYGCGCWECSDEEVERSTALEPMKAKRPYKPPATAVYTAYIMAGVSYSSVAYGLIGGLYHSWAKAIVIALANWVL